MLYITLGVSTPLKKYKVNLNKNHNKTILDLNRSHLLVEL
jgi:hypothetical protein